MSRLSGYCRAARLFPRATRVALAAAFWLAASTTGALCQSVDPVHPVKVSKDGRYFVDQNGDPVFWLGTTQWQLFREYTLEDARSSSKTKASGFAFVQVMLMGVGDGTKPERLRGEALDRRQSADAQRGLFQERGCRRPDRPRQQPGHLHDALPPAVPQAHHRPKRPGVGEMAGPAVQGRPNRLVHDARGEAGIRAASCGSWPRACARATAGAT